MAGTKRPLPVTHGGAESDACWQLTSLTCFVDLSDAAFVLRLGVSDGSGVRENWNGATRQRRLILPLDKRAGGATSVAAQVATLDRRGRTGNRIFFGFSYLNTVNSTGALARLATRVCATTELLAVCQSLSDAVS